MNFVIYIIWITILIYYLQIKIPEWHGIEAGTLGIEWHFGYILSRFQIKQTARSKILLISHFCKCIFFVWQSVSLWSPDCTRTHSIDQVDLNFTDICLSLPQFLELKQALNLLAINVFYKKNFWLFLNYLLFTPNKNIFKNLLGLGNVSAVRGLALQAWVHEFKCPAPTHTCRMPHHTHIIYSAVSFTRQLEVILTLITYCLVI